MNRRRLLSSLFIAVVALGVVGSGCKTNDKPDSAQFASVEIRGQTPQDIRDVLVTVFREHAYKLTSGNLSSLVFEKPGSTMNNIAYSNFMGGSIVVRAKVAVVPVTGEQYRVECHAFLVRNDGEVLEEEVPVKGIHSGQYQKMLDEIAKRLGQR